MKRLLSATIFLLVLMAIGTSIAFAGVSPGLSTYGPVQESNNARNIPAVFIKVWTALRRQN
jgi:hypothetical protein